MAATEILKTRVTPEMKSRVDDIAKGELLTQAVWLRRLVTRALEKAGSAAVKGGERNGHRGAFGDRFESKERGPATRLYVRLRREDRLLLHERAAARGMASATYVSILVRAHLRGLTPLPRDELAALKRAVGELGAVGRNLNQIARATNQGARVVGPGREEVLAILKICQALRNHTKNVIRTNTASWATGYAEDGC
jgi:predicted transcriptional regulator